MPFNFSSMRLRQENGHYNLSGQSLFGRRKGANLARFTAFLSGEGAEAGITSLNLSNNGLSFSDISAILAVLPSSVRSLVLSDNPNSCSDSSSSLIFIRKLLGNPGLMDVELNNVGLSNDTAQLLSKPRTCYYSIERNQINKEIYDAVNKENDAVLRKEKECRSVKQGPEECKSEQRHKKNSCLHIYALLHKFSFPYTSKSSRLVAQDTASSSPSPKCQPSSPI